MGREVKSVVEAALDLYLNGSVDDAYRVASMDEQINHYFETIRDLATEEIKKIQKPLLRVVIISKLFPTWSVSVTMLKISVNGLST